MSESQRGTSEIYDIVESLLPKINEGLDWETVKARFDPNPEGKAITMHFMEPDGDTLADAITLAVAPGPSLAITTENDERFEKVGDIVTYEDYGLRVLDPDDEMTPSKARYQKQGVRIQAVEGESRERVWFIGKAMLEIMLDELKRQASEE